MYYLHLNTLLIFIALFLNMNLWAQNSLRFEEPIKDTNSYFGYYKLINQANSAIVLLKDTNQAIQYFKQAFRLYKYPERSHIWQLMNLYFHTKQVELAKKEMYHFIATGLQKDEALDMDLGFDKYVNNWLNQKYLPYMDEFKQIFRENRQTEFYNPNYNPKIREEITQLIETDQRIRGFRRTNLSLDSLNKLHKIDSLNFSGVFEITQKYSFPGIKSLGTDIFVQVIFLHNADRFKEMANQQRLYKLLENGDISPFTYALVMDRIHIFDCMEADKPVKTLYATYQDTNEKGELLYMDTENCNTIELIDERRRKIGLSSLWLDSKLRAMPEIRFKACK